MEAEQYVVGHRGLAPGTYAVPRISLRCTNRNGDQRQGDPDHDSVIRRTIAEAATNSRSVEAGFQRRT
jgi:hypothetical protein